eukprot:Hpha_TRINITY_DN15841_c2_g1::TRINITY_DN15841_c2_g1_i2::g.191062::m.191062
MKIPRWLMTAAFCAAVGGEIVKCKTKNACMNVPLLQCANLYENCVIECTGSNACTGSTTFACPQIEFGFSCVYQCTGAGSCATAQFDCTAPGTGYCEVMCKANEACASSTATGSTCVSYCSKASECQSLPTTPCSDLWPAPSVAPSPAGGGIAVAPTMAPSVTPTVPPSAVPSVPPSAAPTAAPTAPPTTRPTTSPTTSPTTTPTTSPSASPTVSPTTSIPTASPSSSPTKTPTISPSSFPTWRPTVTPTRFPTASTPQPSAHPTQEPTVSPSLIPTPSPTTSLPTATPSVTTSSPTTGPSNITGSPTLNPETTKPTSHPTYSPKADLGKFGSETPSGGPTGIPTDSPSATPPKTSAEATTETAGEIGGAGMVVSAAALGAAGAAQGARLAMAASDCSTFLVDSVPWIMHPTQVNLGGFSKPAHAGCVVMNMVLFGGMGLLHKAGTYIVLSLMRQCPAIDPTGGHARMFDAEGLIAFPSGTLAIGVLLAQGTTVCGARMMRDAAGAGDAIIGLLGGMFGAALAVAITHIGRGAITNGAVYKRDREYMACIRDYVLGDGEWVSWRKAHSERWGVAFRAALPTHLWILAFDVWISFGIGLAYGFAGSSCTSCGVIRIIDFTGCVALLAAIGKRNPYVHPARRYGTIIAQVLIGLGAILLAFNYFDSELCESGRTMTGGRADVAGVLILSGGILVTVTILLDGLISFYASVGGRRKRLRDALQRFKDLDKDGSGTLDIDEVRQGIQKIYGVSVSPERLSKLFNEISKGDEEITIHQFIDGEWKFWALVDDGVPSSGDLSGDKLLLSGNMLEVEEEVLTSPLSLSTPPLALSTDNRLRSGRGDGNIRTSSGRRPQRHRRSLNVSGTFGAGDISPVNVLGVSRVASASPRGPQSIRGRRSPPRGLADSARGDDVADFGRDLAASGVLGAKQQQSSGRRALAGSQIRPCTASVLFKRAPENNDSFEKEGLDASMQSSPRRRFTTKVEGLVPKGGGRGGSVLGASINSPRREV